MITNFITFVLSNFSLSFLIVGLLCSGISLIVKPKPLSRSEVAEALLSYYCLMAIGLCSPGNAGVVLWTDLLIPFLGFIFLYFCKENRKAETIP